MTTERMDGELYFCCDVAPCKHNVSYDGDTSFAEAWQSAKREGWSTWKIGSDWLHACPDCGRKKLGNG